MDLSLANGAPTDVLIEHVKDLIARADRLAKWESLSGTDWGAFLKEDRKKELEKIQSAYRGIDAAEEGAAIRFARLQGMELVIAVEMNQLENALKERLTLDKEVESVQNIIQARARGDAKETRKSEIIPDLPKQGENA